MCKCPLTRGSLGLAFLLVSSVAAHFPIGRLTAQTVENRVFDDGMGNTMQYRLYLPPGHDEPGAEFPVVVWLHGAGGTIGSRPQGLVDAVQSEPYAAFLVEPQATGTNFSTPVPWTTCRGVQNVDMHVHCPPGVGGGIDSVLGILDEVEAEFSIDPSQRIVSGFSAGGVGSFELLLRQPGVFSTAVPIAGGSVVRHIREPVDARIWAIHGHDDTNLLPFWTSDSIEAITKLGGSPIYLEPSGGHSPFPEFFRDPDNELYPWMFDGVEPPLAQLIYNPASGNLQVNAESAPGGAISRMALTGLTSAPRITAIEGDPLDYANGRLTYDDSDDGGFGGVIDLGNVLPPGMDLTELHATLDVPTYDSPAATQTDRTFRLVIPPSPADQLPPSLAVEEPWIVYRVNRRGDAPVDLGLSSRSNVGHLQDADLEERIVAKFRVPEFAGAAQKLEQAVLRIYLDRAVGGPGEVALWHAVGDNDFDLLATDFDDSLYVDADITLASSMDEMGRYYEADVTELVRSDYLSDPDHVVAAFRLQLGAALGTDPSFFRLAMPRDRAHFPQLVLTFVPEPPSGLMGMVLALAAAGVLIRRPRCKTRV